MREAQVAKTGRERLIQRRTTLDEPISWEMKRRLVEVLVAGVRIDTVEECGVKQNKITITYRFSEPDLPMSVVLTQSYGSGGGDSDSDTATDRRGPPAICDAIRRQLGQWRQTEPHIKHDDWVLASEEPTKPTGPRELLAAEHQANTQKAWPQLGQLPGTPTDRRHVLNAQGGADSSIIAAQWGHTVNVSTNVYNEVGIAR